MNKKYALMFGIGIGVPMLLVFLRTMAPSTLGAVVLAFATPGILYAMYRVGQQPWVYGDKTIDQWRDHWRQKDDEKRTKED